MIDENGNEVASAQVTEAPVEQNQGNEGNGQNGIQKRFDELTAKIYEANARADAAMAANAQLLAQRVQAPVAPVVDEVEVELAKAESYLGAEAGAAVRAALKAQEAKFVKQLGATHSILRAQSAEKELSQLAQSKGIKDPRVTARAQALLQDWTNKGLSFNAADAMTFAAGEFSMNPGQPRQVDGRFAPTDAVITTPGAPPVPVQRGVKPQNFDRLSADQQIQWFDANGVGDKEF